MRLFIAIALALVLSSGALAATVTCVMKREFKGVELYSWRTPKSEWQFAVVPGTNRRKSESEIKSRRACMHTLVQAQGILAQLGKGDQVFWIERQAERFFIPPTKTVAVLTASAARSGARLRVQREAHR